MERSNGTPTGTSRLQKDKILVFILPSPEFVETRDLEKSLNLALVIFEKKSNLLADLSRQAYKVSLKYTHAPASAVAVVAVAVVIVVVVVVVNNFKHPLKSLGWSKLNFMWSLLGKGEQGRHAHIW